MRKRLKVLIVEPSYIICTGLEKLLTESGRYDVLGFRHNTDNMATRVEQQKPDVLLINPTVLPFSQHTAPKSLFPQRPHMAIVALVYQYMEAAVLKSYHGLLDIRESQTRLADLLCEAHAAAQTDKIQSDNYELTQRETSVLVLVSKGLMSKEIAEKLHISIHTVISHRKNITRKTGIKSVAGLAVYAMLNNLMENE